VFAQRVLRHLRLHAHAAEVSVGGTVDGVPARGLWANVTVSLWVHGGLPTGFDDVVGAAGAGPATRLRNALAAVLDAVGVRTAVCVHTWSEGRGDAAPPPTQGGSDAAAGLPTHARLECLTEQDLAALVARGSPLLPGDDAHRAGQAVFVVAVPLPLAGDGSTPTTLRVSLRDWFQPDGVELAASGAVQLQLAHA
jgi:hypothetical protein